MTDWTITESWTCHGRHVGPGDELSIVGERGRRFRFQRHVLKPDGTEWIDVVGDTGFRSFRPGRVKTVHRTRKTAPALAAFHRDKVKAKRVAA